MDRPLGLHTLWWASNYINFRNYLYYCCKFLSLIWDTDGWLLATRCNSDVKLVTSALTAVTQSVELTLLCHLSTQKWVGGFALAGEGANSSCSLLPTHSTEDQGLLLLVLSCMWHRHPAPLSGFGWAGSWRLTFPSFQTTPELLTAALALLCACI